MNDIMSHTIEIVKGMMLRDPDLKRQVDEVMANELERPDIHPDCPLGDAP